MKFFVQNTALGLIPLYPSDLSEKKKLRIGEVYEADIKRPRNIGFHRKAFALFQLGWHNTSLELPFDIYRKIMTMRAGFFTAYDTGKGVHYDADSLSFGNMDDDKFAEVYSRVLDVIIKDIGSTSEDVERELVNFM